MFENEIERLLFMSENEEHITCMTIVLVTVVIAASERNMTGVGT